MKKPQQEYINLVGRILTDEILLHPKDGFYFNVQDGIGEKYADATAHDIHDFINGLQDALDFFENAAKSDDAARIFKNPAKASDLLQEELLKTNPTVKPSAELTEEARERQDALSVLVSFAIDAAGANQESILEKIRELKDRVMFAASHAAADYHISDNALLMKVFQRQETIIAGQEKAAAGQSEIIREVKAGNKYKPEAKEQPKKPRHRYPTDIEAVEVLKEAAKRYNRKEHINQSMYGIMLDIARDGIGQGRRSGQGCVRMLYGKLKGAKSDAIREKSKPTTPEKAAKTWQKHLSAFIIEHPTHQRKK